MSPEFKVDGFLILAGRRWRILDLDHERKAIAVQPFAPAECLGLSLTVGRIHPRVRQMMKSLLEGADLPTYLDSKAREMLHQARSTAREANLRQTSFLQDGPRTVWFTWTGTKIQRTLYGLGSYFGGFDVSDEGTALVFEDHDFQSARSVQCTPDEWPQCQMLAERFPICVREKYEVYLSDELTARLFARERIDLHGLVNLSLGIAQFRTPEPEDYERKSRGTAMLSRGHRRSAQRAWK